MSDENKIFTEHSVADDQTQKNSTPGNLNLEPDELKKLKKEFKSPQKRILRS